MRHAPDPHDEEAKTGPSQQRAEKIERMSRSTGMRQCLHSGQTPSSQLKINLEV
jgi:hypothetical protein